MTIAAITYDINVRKAEIQNILICLCINFFNGVN